MSVANPSNKELKRAAVAFVAFSFFVAGSLILTRSYFMSKTEVEAGNPASQSSSSTWQPIAAIAGAMTSQGNSNRAWGSNITSRLGLPNNSVWLSYNLDNTKRIGYLNENGFQQHVAIPSNTGGMLLFPSGEMLYHLGFPGAGMSRLLGLSGQELREIVDVVGGGLITSIEFDHVSKDIYYSVAESTGNESIYMWRQNTGAVPVFGSRAYEGVRLVGYDRPNALVSFQAKHLGIQSCWNLDLISKSISEKPCHTLQLLASDVNYFTNPASHWELRSYNVKTQVERVVVSYSENVVIDKITQNGGWVGYYLSVDNLSGGEEYLESYNSESGEVVRRLNIPNAMRIEDVSIGEDGEFWIIASDFQGQQLLKEEGGEWQNIEIPECSSSCRLDFINNNYYRYF